jgi:transcriptional regulator
MYIPKHYEETRLPVLHQLMRDYPLATLITHGPDGVNVNHIPIYLDSTQGEFGTLRAHVARANPIWQEAQADGAVVVVFHGPNTYVSPQWNPAKKLHGKAVPTWNYAVVHCHGRLRVVDDAAFVRANVDELSARHEAALPPPWTLDDAPADYAEKMLAAIVGLECVIERIVGKWKVSQNHPSATQQATVDGMLAHQGRGADAMADLMAERLKQPT